MTFAYSTAAIIAAYPTVSDFMLSPWVAPVLIGGIVLAFVPGIVVAAALFVREHGEGTKGERDQ